MSSINLLTKKTNKLTINICSDKRKKKMEVEAERVSEPNDAVCAATNGLERGSVLGIDLEMVA